ncbi:MAG: type II secretion system F family protein, partial [Gemmatimonadetes bacterium]|nr:type II secretion system F family protein [Gemmatimonadota bacterium]
FRSMRLHYLASLFAGSVGLLAQLLLPLEEGLGSPWLPATAAPYFLLYWRDLVQAGYRRPEAVSVFWGARLAALLALPIVIASSMLVAGATLNVSLLAGVWAAMVGWVVPKFSLRIRANARRREIDRTLPDALDLLVVCMEAGLGMNQAVIRMAEEIRHFSTATSDEFVLLNLEMRAGVPRAEALRRLGARMGVADLRSLATMLIQADRFGTSVGQALRVHAETARTRRRQRAEEAAAKTTVKLIFPIVLCVFPSVFVVVLGPAVLGLIRGLSDL